MRAISTANQTALSERALVARDFLWFVARNRVTGLPETVGFWSDLENVSAQVLDPDTLGTVTRSYYGAGGLIEIEGIPAVSTIQVQDVVIQMSQLDEMVQQAVRLYDLKQARVEIHRGLFDPVSRNLVAPAIVRFVGFVNLVDIRTPRENEAGGVQITCVSHTQELLRSNPSTRSHEDQRYTRDPNDFFFVDAGVSHAWDYQWGQNQAQQVQTKPKGLFGWGGGFFGL